MKAMEGLGLQGLAAFVVPFCVTNGVLVPGDGLLLIAGGCMGDVFRVLLRGGAERSRISWLP